MDLQDKVVFMTGAATGIGRAAAVHAARHGARLALCDINTAALEETAQLCSAQGADVITQVVRLPDADAISAALDAAVQHFGGLQGAFNNAGVGGELLPVEDLDEAMWDLTLGVNLKAVWLCMKYEIPRMKGGGSIVNTASVAGLVGFRFNAVYAASKHGVIGLTKSAALETARRKIRINALCPGFVDTPMVHSMDEARPGMVDRLLKTVPMHRLGQTDEIAEAVVWLLSDKSSFMTGHAMVLDGGISIE
jgi:NAD(P)-dependent dehydrogenase (short-subunit alcohol dehydrogenase family)